MTRTTSRVGLALRGGLSYREVPPAYEVRQYDYSDYGSLCETGLDCCPCLPCVNSCCKSPALPRMEYPAGISPCPHSKNYVLYGNAMLKPLPTINICYVEHPRSRRAYYNPNDTLSVEVEQVD